MSCRQISAALAVGCGSTGIAGAKASDIPQLCSAPWLVESSGSQGQAQTDLLQPNNTRICEKTYQTSITGQILLNGVNAVLLNY